MYELILKKEDVELIAAFVNVGLLARGIEALEGANRILSLLEQAEELYPTETQED